MRSLIVSLVFAVAAAAQTAKVVMLSPADAARVKAAHEKLAAAQAEYDAIRKQVEATYLQVSEGDPDRGICFTGAGANFWPNSASKSEPKYWRKGFDATCGAWEFSDDFRFVVPLRIEQPPAKWGTWPWTIQPAFLSGPSTSDTLHIQSVTP